MTLELISFTTKEQKLSWKKWLIACFISLIIFSSAGCAQLSKPKAGKTTKPERQAETTPGSQTAGEKMLEGQAEVRESQGKLPLGFPEEFPIYKGAELIKALKTVSEEGKSFHVILETSDGQSVVAEYYERSLPENGFDIEASLEAPDEEVFTLKQGRKEVGLVHVYAEDSRTIIDIALTP